MSSIIQNFANVWIGLANISDLLFAWPLDLVLAFTATFAFLCVLAVKRIFWE